jgi:hypothetical protein
MVKHEPELHSAARGLKLTEVVDSLGLPTEEIIYD